MTREERKKSGLGCVVKPLILGLACVGGGAFMMDGWATLSGPLRALSIGLVVFGAMLLLPVTLVIAFKLWTRRLRQTLKSEMGDFGDGIRKIREETIAIYQDRHEYRAATPDDFAGLDIAFYDETEAYFTSKGFRRLGDRVDQTIQDLGKPSPPIRTMVSSGGTVSVGIYHVKMGSKSIRMIDLETEFSDGTFLTTSNSAGLDLSTSPPGIERRQLAPESAAATMLEIHEGEMAKLTAAMSGRTCVVMQTLNELFDMQKRMHTLKAAARQKQGYVDEGEIKRGAEVGRESQKEGGPKASFLSRIAEAQREAAEAKARKAAERGPGFLTGSGKAEPEIVFEAPPEGELELDEKSQEGLRGMITMINKAKGDREKKLMAALPMGAGRFGGLPDLPPSLAWPMAWNKKIPFLAQIDLSALPQWEGRLLPANGWLYAFGLFDNEGEHKPDAVKVMLHQGPGNELMRASRPHPEDIWPDWQNVAVYEMLELNSRFRGTDAMEKRREKEKKAAEKAGAPRSRDAGHLFGEPLAMGDTAGDIADMLDRSGNDWINLLTLRSQGSMQWSDAGYLNIVIRRSELEKGDFSNVCGAIWSS